MDNENFLLNSSTTLPPLNMEVQGMEMNYLPSCLFDLNWDNSIDQAVQFKSELSPIVSSPNSSNAAAPSDSNLARESIAKLGKICSLNEISPQSQILDSPRGFSPPPIFRNSTARTHSSLSPGSADPGTIEVGLRKRKAAPRGKTNAKVPKAEEGDSNAKKCRSTEATETANYVEKPNHKQNKDNIKPPEQPKQDFIHVRARRGQATDSHSLAERVRREKISERMKLLQDLVPGCNKVTGKAPMLDEIINYVQSLQCQVEFLSMKLATVNPRLDFNIDTLLSKNILQLPGSFPHMMNPLDSSTPPTFPYGYQPQHGPLQSFLCNGSKAPCAVDPLETIDGYGGSAFQIGNLLEDDLQSMAHQIGFEQNCETALPLQMLRGQFPTDHMKIEL